MQSEEWLWDYKTRDIRSAVVHSKNDRHVSHQPISFTFPRGPLAKLMLAHVEQGQHLLTLRRGDLMPMLMVTREENAFSDATFVHYWGSLMASTDTKGLDYFAPSCARTVFVEDYTSMHGVAPELWDGAADVMGNCVAQWAKSYNPSRKARRVQQAVEQHAAYSARRLES